MLSPASVTAGGPPFTLTVNGTGFVAGGSLVLNGASGVPYTFVSATQVTLLIDAMYIKNSGSISVVATIPTPNTTPSNTLNLTINAFTSSACILYGINRFLFTGFDGNGPVTVAGSFGVDANGNITGEEDFKSTTDTRVAQPITAGSCTNSATANEGTVSLTTSTATFTYTFALQQDQNQSPRGRMQESADGTGISGSGRFIEAPPDGFFSGDYVFGLVGSDSSGGRMSVVGRVTDTNNNQFSTPGTLSNGLGDINDAGNIIPTVTITGGVGVPDSFSRSTGTVTIGGQAYQFVYYVNSSGGGFIMDIDTGALSPNLAGLISSQANAGALGNANFTPFVFSIWGASPGPPAASDTWLGLGSGVDSVAGTFNLQYDEVAADTPNLNQAITGATFAVDITGRTFVTYMLGGQTVNFLYYLDGSGGGYIQELSGDSVGFGTFSAQTAGPYSNSSINGTFAVGTFLPTMSTSPNTEGIVTLNNGVISGDLTGTYAVDASGTGRGTATVSAPLFGSNHLVFYIFGLGGVEVMGSDGVTNDAIGFLHQ
jgi:hypothetical protein